MAQARHRSAETLVDEAAVAFADAAVGPEGMEGVSAFIEKRAPRWAVQ
jgi:isohexenylglutaconyl-CoA hydratase